jgi:RND family efflux transporter MFP subunit
MAAALTPKQLKLLSFAVRSTVGLLLLVAAIMIFDHMLRTRQGAAGNPNPQVARHVEAILARSVSVPKRYTGYGTARAMLAANIAAEVSANVMYKPEQIEEGAYVDQGDLIVKLDDTDFIQAQNRALANIEALAAELRSLQVEEERLSEQYRLAQQATALAQAELEKLREAGRAGGTTALEIDRTERELTRIQREEQALRQQLDLLPTRRSRLEAQQGAEQSQVALAEKNIDRTRITAPFPGYIQHVNVDVGEHVAPGTRVARLVDLSRIEIPLSVPVSAAEVVRAGDAALVQIDEPGTPPWQGEVIRIAPEADQETRTITVYVEVEQPALFEEGARLRPGQFVMGELRAEQNERAIVVPRRAVIEDRILIVDEEGKARSVQIEVSRHAEGSYPNIDPQEREWAVVRGGLAPGETVIISNLDELEPGMAVEPRLPGLDFARDGETP